MKILLLLQVVLLSTGTVFAAQKSYAATCASLYEVRLTLLEEALIQGASRDAQRLITDLIVNPAHDWWLGYTNYEGNDIVGTAIAYNRSNETLQLCRVIKAYFGADVLFSILHRSNCKNFTPLELAAIHASDKTIELLIRYYSDFFKTEELLIALEYLFCAYFFKHGFEQSIDSVVLDEKLRSDDLERRSACKDSLCWHLATREGGRALVHEVLARWHNYFRSTGIPLPKGMFLSWKL